MSHKGLRPAPLRMLPTFAASPTPHSTFTTPPQGRPSANYAGPLQQALGHSGQPQAYPPMNPAGYSYIPGSYAPTASNPLPHAPYGHSPYQQPIPNRPLVNRNGQPLQETTQSPSGSAAALPTRPTFDTPDIGREAMEKIHAGQHPHNSVSGVHSASINVQPSSQGFTPAKQDLEDLIAEGMAAAQRVAHENTEEENNTANGPDVSLDENRNSHSNVSAINGQDNSEKDKAGAIAVTTQPVPVQAVQSPMARSKTDWARRVKAPEELRKSSRFEKFKHHPWSIAAWYSTNSFCFPE